MRRLFPLFALFLALTVHAEINPEWTTALPPFRIADNLYYVGSQELAAYLVTTPAGNILINANLETSPPQIRASVEKLGFHWAETKILLNGRGFSVVRRFRRLTQMSDSFVVRSVAPERPFPAN
jgi:metallo-beta-lactamase class B